MQIMFQFILKQRVSVLTLLLALSEAPQQSESTHQLFPIPQLATVSFTSIDFSFCLSDQLDLFSDKIISSILYFFYRNLTLDYLELHQLLAKAL